MGPMGGGIPSAAAEESDSFSGMQPTVTPETSIPTSPDGAAEPEPDMAPISADSLQTGENQIPMSAEETGETPAPMEAETGEEIAMSPEAALDIPFSPENPALEPEGLSGVPLEPSAAGLTGMEQGGIAVSGAGIPAGASISAGEAGSEPTSLESGADTQTVLGGGTTIPAATATPSGGSSQVLEDTYSPGAQSAAFAGQYAGGSGASPYTEPPTFRNIEMGSGRITGTEISPQHPTGIRFAMYHAGQYTQPEGKFTTVTSRDREKWYKQYAVPTVERTPVRTETDKRTQQEKVICDEKIVQKLPRAPARRDR